MAPNLAVLQAGLIVLTGLVMLVGLAGAVLPVLPGAWLIWLAALGYGLTRPLLGGALFDGWIGGAAMAVLTLLAAAELGLEYLVTHSVAARAGVSFGAILASLVLGLVCLPLFPPLGPLAGAVAGLFAVEYFRHGRDWRRAGRSVLGYARGRGWAMLAELALCTVMIGVWVAWVALSVLAG